jgi:hypothetical protein
MVDHRAGLRLGFLGSAAAAPMVSILYERTGSMAAGTTVGTFRVRSYGVLSGTARAASRSRPARVRRLPRD